ncbi:MAG: pantoate--beta-alanine ligase [Beijerinckiaceae bacterium]
MAQITVVRTVKALRRQVAAWQAAGERVALVPTMGALHEGHISLVRAAHRRADRVIVSIFVNPTQFAPNEDFSKYPRTFAQDRAMLTQARADLIYAPTVDVMYPAGACTTVSLDGPAKAGLEDAFRPTHFAGVATIVAKLFTQCGPDVALFGEKDFQQLKVVTQMARDLDLPVNVIGCPTVRERDGLAMSSRNRYLLPDDRARAAVVPSVLRQAAENLRNGVTPARAMKNARSALEKAGFVVDYVEARDAGTLAPLTRGQRDNIRLLVAAKIGATRLIDNMAV